jgi:hypothetical protein
MVLELQGKLNRGASPALKTRHICFYNRVEQAGFFSIHGRTRKVISNRFNRTIIILGSAVAVQNGAVKEMAYSLHSL